MNESTARAERFDLQTSTSSFFLWEVPHKPVAVRIPYELIERLEREAVDSFRSVTSKGSEIGGLLLGDVAPGSPMVVSVAEYQLIDCEYSRGPLYRLSDADLMRFQRAMEQRGSSGAGIAGFFRTHTRKGISLDSDDLAVLDGRFRDPHHIALLVRPFATKASTGAIFIREGGKMSGDVSYLEFPFRKPAGEHRASGEGSEAKTAPPLGPAPQAPPAAKPSVRAQIVPIASRREISLPGAAIEDKAPDAAPAAVQAVAPAIADHAPAWTEPKAEAKPAPKPEPAVKAEARPADKPEPKPEAAARVEAKSTPKPEPKPEPAAKVEVKPAAKTEPKVEVKIAPKAEAPVEPRPAPRELEKAVTVDVPAPAFDLEAAPKSGKALKMVLAAAAATALFVLLFVYPGLLRHSSRAPSTPQDTSALQLRVERTNGELLLTWNRDSDAIRNATKAVLNINDGQQHENVDMDLAQLRNGSIVYSPQTADISFKMEVTGKDASKVISESVRVLRTRPSALDQQDSAAAKPGQTAPAASTTTPAAGANPAPATSSTPAAEQAADDPNATPAPKPVLPTRAFNAQNLSARLRPAQSSDLPDAPTVGGALPSSAIPGVNLSAVTATPSAPAAPPPPPAQVAHPKAGGQIQQAVLIYKKEPDYPKLARQTGARGAVRLTATVGKDGKVKSVRVISGHTMLQAPAIEAVKQWIYKPTLLNGQPVETDTEIVLNFVGDR